jgi:hypothetical protein
VITERPRRLTKEEISTMIPNLGDQVGGLRFAAPKRKAEIYRDLGLKLTYKPQERIVRAEMALNADRMGKLSCPRGKPNQTHIPTCSPGRSAREQVADDGESSGGGCTGKPVHPPYDCDQRGSVRCDRSCGEFRPHARTRPGRSSSPAAGPVWCGPRLRDRRLESISFMGPTYANASPLGRSSPKACCRLHPDGPVTLSVSGPPHNAGGQRPALRGRLRLSGCGCHAEDVQCRAVVVIGSVS